MSIAYTKVETKLWGEKFGIPLKFIRATIDPATRHQLNLPANYEYRSIVIPRRYADWSDRMLNFEIRKDDIWIAGVVKTGTTWMHNIAWQLANGLDFNAPVKKCNDEFFEEVNYFDKSSKCEKLLQYEKERTEKFNQFDKLVSPRCFKTHLAAYLLPKDIWTAKSKIIYIARNPKDVIVSLYHMFRNNAMQYNGTLEQLAETFQSNQVNSYFDHLFSYWQLRNLDHVLFLTYEEFSANPFDGVKKISEFIGCSYDDNQLRQLTDFTTFDNFRKHNFEYMPVEFTGWEKKDPNYRHCRKGKVGSYRDDMSDELIEKLNHWMAEGMKEFDFEFAE